MVRRLLVIGVAGALLAACASTSSEPGGEGGASGSPAPSPSSVSTGNGTLYSSAWAAQVGSVTINAHPIGADGSLGTPAELLSGPASDTTFPGVVDGKGPLALTGTFTDYWTTDVQLHSDGQVTDEVAAPRWCGGEGLLYNVCTLLDEARLARTTDLGRDPETGEGPAEGSIIVSSLADGSTIDEFGPFPDLTMMLGTDSPDEVLLVTTPFLPAEEPSAPSDVLRLDVTDGSVTELGVSPVGWAPLCAIGADSVLGFTFEGSTSTALVVGPAQVADVTWEQQDSVVGCSADGRFLYLQRIPQPPTEDVEDTEPPNPGTAVERISLADGSRSQVLVLPAGQYAGPITR